MRGRNSPFKPRPRRTWRAPGELLNFTLYFLCAVLLVLSRIGHDAVIDLRDRFVDLTAPVLEATSMPAIMGRQALDRARSYIGLAEEIEEQAQKRAHGAPERRRGGSCWVRVRRWIGHACQDKRVSTRSD